MHNKDYSTELSNILDTMMDVFYRTDSEGRLVLVTPSIFDLLGYEVDEVLGRPVTDLYEFPEMRGEVMELVKENGGSYRGAEMRLRHKDGSRVWVSSNIRFHYDDMGNFAGVEGMVRDITRHKRTEENLRKSEQTFRAIIDHMLDIYYRTDAEGRLIMASPSCEELLGYTPEELIGTRLSDLYVDPSTREIFMQKLIERGGKYYGFENSLRRKDGSIIWAVASSQFYFDNEGNIAGVEGIVRDNTKRKQMEDALRESEEKLRTIFENMMDTYVRTDREGNIIMISPSVEKLLGYKPKEVVGKQLKDFYSTPAERDAFLRLLEENNGHYYGYELQVRHKNGEQIWVLINAQFYYGDDGKIAGVEALGRNISDIKCAEEELTQAKEEAEAANNAKTEFLSNMSHELRTPLNAILGFSSLLVKYNSQPLPDKVVEFLHNIHEAGSHLSSLINQVLDLAKIESGTASVDLVPVDIDAIIKDVLRLLRPLAVKQRVKLHYAGESAGQSTEPLWVKADALRLRQVMINLITNAIKYNHENGLTEVVCKVDGGSVEVSVIDTGIGIPTERHHDIFQPFTRVHENNHIEGSGIGLTVTRKNLELMASDIHFSSRSGEGSRFWFTLPLVSAERKNTEYDRNMLIPEQPLGISVLYIEDNAIGMRLMEEVIATLPGVTFYKASTGEEGFRLAMDVLPDLIIMDINLPDISGFEVLERLLKTKHADNFHFVALSASALDEDVEKGLQAGFMQYLRKPFEPEEIIQLLADLASIAPQSA
ncbi:MAG: PAS domain S-box protein [Gammaproteobacteria bacterium]|nr:PAS domain S-box protein [Gammaproteobacteria bacterium]